MLVHTAARRVAIVGGSRIPFARSYGAYTGQSNQDLLVAALRALVERFRLQGQRLGDVIGGAVIKHSRDLQPGARIADVRGPRSADPGARHPARLRHRARGRHSGRQQDCARSDRCRHRLRRRHRQRSAGGAAELLRRTAAAQLPRPQPRAASRAVAETASARSQAHPAGGGRAAHRLVDGPELRADGQDLEDLARRAGSGGGRQPPQGRRGLEGRLLRRPGGRRTPGLQRDNNVRPDATLEKLGHAAPGVRHQRLAARSPPATARR